MKELLEELVDLRELRPHGRPHAAVGRHDPHHFEQPIRAALWQRHVLDAVVSLGDAASATFRRPTRIFPFVGADVDLFASW